MGETRVVTILIRPLVPADRPAWEPLWDAYLTFYDTTLAVGVTDEVWRRLFDPLETVGALGAFDDGELVGICHHLFHRTTWSLKSACYLEDLFTASATRGQGIGRALVEGTAAVARGGGADKLYWQTKATNATARSLYDSLAHHDGYLVYDYDLA